MITDLTEFDELVLHAALVAAIREVNPEAGVPTADEAEEQWVVARDLVYAMGWWQFARGRASAVVRIDGELTPGFERGPGASVRRDLAVLRTPIWCAPVTPVEVRSEKSWIGAIVQHAQRDADIVTLSVRIVDDASETDWLPTALEPTMSIARFIDIFDEVLANRTWNSEALSSPGRRKLIVMTMVKLIDRAGWLLADFPVESPVLSAPPAP